MDTPAGGGRQLRLGFEPLLDVAEVFFEAAAGAAFDDRSADSRERAAQRAGARPVHIEDVERVRVAHAVTGDDKRERGVEVPAGVHVPCRRDVLVRAFGRQRHMRHGNERGDAELFLRPVQARMPVYRDDEASGHG